MPAPLSPGNKQLGEPILSYLGNRDRIAWRVPVGDGQESVYVIGDDVQRRRGLSADSIFQSSAGVAAVSGPPAPDSAVRSEQLRRRSRPQAAVGAPRVPQPPGLFSISAPAPSQVRCASRLA